MTTATQTRPKKKKKAAAKKDPGKTKKPKWSLVTFAKIEKWRVKLGLSKSGMAEALGVTNSTFHNWRRGTTVPHPNQQEEIVQRIDALEKNAGSSEGTGAVPSKGRKPKKAGRQGTKRTGTENASVSGDGTDGLNGSGEGGSGRASLARTNGSATRPPHQGVVPPGTLLSHPKVLRADIADITVAFIQSQKKAVSAGSVVEFVRSLREVL